MHAACFDANRGLTRGVGWLEEPHDSPHEACQCGIYAYHTPGPRSWFGEAHDARASCRPGAGSSCTAKGSGPSTRASRRSPSQTVRRRKVCSRGNALLHTMRVPRPPEAFVPDAPPVRELRVAVTAPDYDEALAFYRDVLGLPEREAFASEDGRVTILEAGRATLELLDPRHAAFVDEVEVGRRVAGHVRIAFEVADSEATTRALATAGATVVAAPTRTPWNSLNARLDGPAGLQLTLFSELEA